MPSSQAGHRMSISCTPIQWRRRLRRNNMYEQVPIRSVRSLVCPSVRPSSSSWWPTNGGDCEYDYHRPPLTTDTTHGRVGEWVELRSRRLVGPPSVPLPSPLFHYRIALCLCPAHTWNVADQPPTTHLLSLSLDKYMQTISWRRLRRILQL